MSNPTGLGVHEVGVGVPLVGRREELDFIEATACSPDARSLVVSRVAGVGKTRLVTESLERMRQRELSAAWAVATHSAATLPFGALAHLLPHPLPSAAGPANLLRALSESLIESHPSQRLVVAVDDAHLLDASSAALIHHLGATKSAFVLVTVRTGKRCRTR